MRVAILNTAITERLYMIASCAALIVFDKTNEVDRHSSYKINLTPVPWLGSMRPIRYRLLQVKAYLDQF